jgi:uncharacterized protein (TIGR02328 family)
MRLWHKYLIPYLPQKQLVVQWRECCAIARNIAVNGTPNHLLVNKILKFPTIHFFIYASMIIEEMRNRGYRVSQRSLDNFQKNYDSFKDGRLEPNDIFSRWHNDRYLRQCLYNLQEKYDCGGISECCWIKIMNEFGEYLR